VKPPHYCSDGVSCSFLFIYFIYNEEPEIRDFEKDQAQHQESDNSSIKKVSLIFCLLVTFSDNLATNIHINNTDEK